MPVRVEQAPFDPGAETNAFLRACAGAGAVVGFTGLVRSEPGDPVRALVLECYPELALNQIGRLVDSAKRRFGLIEASVIHRYGRLLPGEPIVQVMAMASHRHAAFQGAEFLMDVLKTEAPFWKKEEGPGASRWVDAKPQDDAAKARWE